MELPDLGKHCSEKSCRQLDFLPMKCDACSLILCKDHLQYDTHSCAGLYKKNIQVNNAIMAPIKGNKPTCLVFRCPCVPCAVSPYL